MPPLIRKTLSNLAAAAIPIGMAAVFTCEAPAASAAPAARIQRAAATSPLNGERPQAHVLTVTARHRHHRRAARLRAYAWALRQSGHPYVWGGTGPGFDCSGLVMMAYRHAGIDLPRTTTEMLASPLLVMVRHPRMGDLAFYGSGHVELFRKWGFTFGAHDSGTLVGLIHYVRRWGWAPTAYYRVR